MRILLRSTFVIVFLTALACTVTLSLRRSKPHNFDADALSLCEGGPCYYGIVSNNISWGAEASLTAHGFSAQNIYNDFTRQNVVVTVMHGSSSVDLLVYNPQFNLGQVMMRLGNPMSVARYHLSDRYYGALYYPDLSVNFELPFEDSPVLPTTLVRILEFSIYSEPENVTNDWRGFRIYPVR
jgi:hypothetical protein